VQLWVSLAPGLIRITFKVVYICLQRFVATGQNLASLKHCPAVLVTQERTQQLESDLYPLAPAMSTVDRHLALITLLHNWIFLFRVKLCSVQPALGSEQSQEAGQQHGLDLA
jgi:hypothetical protein